MNPEPSPASAPVSDGSESARIAGLCRWWRGGHRWRFDGPLPGLVNPGFYRRCHRCGIRQAVSDA